MTVTSKDLETKYALWFHDMNNTEKAKNEILHIFSDEADDGYPFTEQDIYEQSRKIIAKWNDLCENM